MEEPRQPRLSAADELRALSRDLRLPKPVDVPVLSDALRLLADRVEAELAEARGE